MHHQTWCCLHKKDHFQVVVAPLLMNDPDCAWSCDGKASSCAGSAAPMELYCVDLDYMSGPVVAPRVGCPLQSNSIFLLFHSLNWLACHSPEVGVDQRFQNDNFNHETTKFQPLNRSRRSYPTNVHQLDAFWCHVPSWVLHHSTLTTECFASPVQCNLRVQAVSSLLWSFRKRWISVSLPALQFSVLMQTNSGWKWSTNKDINVQQSIDVVSAPAQGRLGFSLW